VDVEIVDIEGVGDLQNERIVLRATADTDIGFLAVFRCKQLNTGKIVAASVPNVYWFENKEVKSKDFIVLYTKSGDRSQKTSDDGITSYFYYWREEAPLWSDKEMRPVLVHTLTWHTFKPK